MAVKDYDFCGWATKNDLRCSDGRTIRHGAFSDCDGKTVPLVWNHKHGEVTNVLGHALLENRPDGVYTYGYFNDTESGIDAKKMVIHGDVTHLSIFANQLQQKGGDVLHGAIREVSLVLAGANPGAIIENVIEHAEIFDDEADIRFISDDTKIELGVEFNNQLKHSEDEEHEPELEHAEQNDNSKGEEKMAEKTVQDVIDTMNEEQKTVLYGLIGQAIEDAGALEEDDEDMKHNLFDVDDYGYDDENYLSHSDEMEIFEDAKRYGSLKDSVLAHGITNIDYLFPDAQTIDNAPGFIKRPDAWVDTVMSNVHRTPFSRIKSIFANITATEARAKGYVKGNLKIDEVFSLLKRTTTPTTIYKKQKLDRDDVIDINEFNVVAWLKTEMRMMLDEEIARAILIGDGRSDASDDKINPLNIRPIWTDDALYTVNKTVAVTADMTEDQKAKAFIRAAIKARKDYRGSGNPVCFMTDDLLTDCLLMEDNDGRVIYETEAKLATALRVSKIVTVPVMENQTRTVDAVTHTLAAIFVNLTDYNVGADKGGAVNMFDDFDIDYNAQKYLIETRCSGALIKPYSAIVVEFIPGEQ